MCKRILLALIVISVMAHIGTTHLLEADLMIDIMKKMYYPEIPETEKAYSSHQDVQPRVQTTSGLLYGAKNMYSNSFFSIPFAIPPIGDYRFKSPERLDTPDVSRNLSTRVSITCAIPGGRLGFEYDEDCLVLTVHVPLNVDLSDTNSQPTERLPVLLFIHGGAYFFGTGTATLYDGRYLSQVTSTIVVTVNYRLGPLGFLVFDDGEDMIEGNQGLKDQQLAMEWVKENIQNFGGDNNKMTLFGQSAGAQSVMFHMLSEASEPLFQRAIMESNPAVYWYPNKLQALSYTDQLIESLRCNVINLNDCCSRLKSNYTCLLEASSQALISGMLKIMGINWGTLDVLTALEPFRPYVDGIEFSDQPMTLFKEGKWSTNKPLILGSTEEEVVVIKYILPMNETIFRVLNRNLFDGKGDNENTGDLISEKYIDLYGATISDYSHIFGIEMTDIIFGCPTRALARFASYTTTSDVYYYIFSHSPDDRDCLGAQDNVCQHSYHGAELDFVFRTFEHTGMKPDDEDVLVSNLFSTYWGNLAWTGNPSQGPDYGLAGNFPKWSRYEGAVPSESAWENLRITTPASYLETRSFEDVCNFWDSLGVYEAPPPSPTISTSTTKQETTTSAAAAFDTSAIIPTTLLFFILEL